MKGGKPKLSVKAERHVIELMATGDYTAAEVGELVGVTRSTVYRIVARHRQMTPAW